MKITKRQLIKIIREEKAILERSPTLMRTGMTSGGKGPMPGPTPKDRDTMVKEIEPQLAAAIESGKTQGIPQGWIDAANADSFHDADPKFSLRRPEANGGPTDEEIMALSKALNPSMFSKFKRMIGMKEGTMKITRRQLRRLIREAVDPEYMREEILVAAEETDVDGMVMILDIVGGSPSGDIDSDFDAVDSLVARMSPEELALVHQEMSMEGLIG